MKPTIIVEDNELSRKLIKTLINHYNLPLEIIGEAERGDDAIQLIKKTFRSLYLWILISLFITD